VRRLSGQPQRQAHGDDAMERENSITATGHGTTSAPDRLFGRVIGNGGQPWSFIVKSDGRTQAREGSSPTVPPSSSSGPPSPCRRWDEACNLRKKAKATSQVHRKMCLADPRGIRAQTSKGACVRGPECRRHLKNAQGHSFTTAAMSAWNLLHRGQEVERPRDEPLATMAGGGIPNRKVGP